ncbi:hypothetical protein [Scytonema sp. NUACC21]
MNVENAWVRSSNDTECIFSAANGEQCPPYFFRSRSPNFFIVFIIATFPNHYTLFAPGFSASPKLYLSSGTKYRRLFYIGSLHQS